MASTSKYPRKRGKVPAIEDRYEAAPSVAPSLPALQGETLDDIVSRMPGLDEKEKWAKYVMAQNFQLTEHPDPDVRAKALERLAKTSVVGLYENQITVNVNTLPADEIQRKLEKLVNRINEKVINAD